MGLHHVTDDGTMHWHCHNPACSHHNCAAWHPILQCSHHDTPVLTKVTTTDQQGNAQHHYIEKPRGRVEGNTHQIHISHDSVIWTDPSMINLPPCAECGERLGLKVHFTEEELAAPNLMRVERDATGTIINVTPHPQLVLHQKVAQQLAGIGKQYKEEQLS